MALDPIYLFGGLVLFLIIMIVYFFFKDLGFKKRNAVISRLTQTNKTRRNNQKKSQEPPEPMLELSRQEKQQLFAKTKNEILETIKELTSVENPREVKLKVLVTIRACMPDKHNKDFDSALDNIRHARFNKFQHLQQLKNALKKIRKIKD
jgi:hypothetical protein